MKVSDIMSKKVITIRSFANVANAVKLMRDHNLNSLIVERLDESDSYGIVTKTDVIYKVAAKGLDPKQVRVCDIMTKPCIVVNPDLNIKSVAQLFANTGIHRAPIIQNRLLGVVSTTDLLLKSNFIEKPSAVLIQEQIEQKIAEAREICAEQGFASDNCAFAWDVVEDLQAEQAHQQAEELRQTAFDEYCAEHPDEEIWRQDPWSYYWEDEELPV
ncbi:CBS domain-containing protein [Pleurocapsales cyanobacterium LEGE 10410]|nr:CBS domain-containing protein [Pleurocapsales cyanobacterium LEGE 10410]